MKRFAACMALLTLLVSACGGSNGAKSSNTSTPAKMSVVVTTTQIADWVNTLAADSVDVYTVVKPGVDPHTYTVSSADTAALARADLVIKNGVDLEPWLDAGLKAANYQGTVADVSAGVLIKKSSAAGAPKAGDPHIWMSASNARNMVSNISKALKAADPSSADLYDSSERAYGAQLDAFVNQASQAIGSLPNKVVVGDHQAYDYFCDEFQMQCLTSATPVDGSSQAPTSDQLLAVAQSLQGRGVKAVFAQANASPTVARGLAADLGVKVLEGNDGLYGDSLGAPGSDGATYLQMMNHDLNVIVNALH